jgi:hypothetical protein
LYFDVPVWLAGIYFWHWYFASLSSRERLFISSVILNPFGLAALLLVVLHQVGISYLRDELHFSDQSLYARLVFYLRGGDDTRGVQAAKQKYPDG